MSIAFALFVGFVCGWFAGAKAGIRHVREADK